MNNENPYAAPIGEGDVYAPPYFPIPFSQRRMHFWRIGRLKAELRSQPLNDRESLPYLLAYVACTALANSIPIENYNPWDAIGFAWSAAITIIGTIYAYRQNGGSAGEHFLQRYFALGWVVMLRCAPAILVSMIAMFMLLERMGWWTDNTGAFDVGFVAVAHMAIYWRLGRHIGDLSQSPDTN